LHSNKIKVNFFQRRPRLGSNFSLEFIFADIRKRLDDKVQSKVFISKCHNDGHISKFINIIEAAFRRCDTVNHITGEVHFLNFLMIKNQVMLTIHDCRMMERKKGAARKIIQWLYLSGPVKKAKIVTTVSEATKREIIKYSGCDPNKVHVIPVAINPIYKPYPRDFNHKKPHILHIGTAPNKNLPRLIKALEGITCHLTIIGKLTETYMGELAKRKIEYSNVCDISDEDLLQKYIDCDILSFVSTFEGFGMPIIEANAVERVVITSNISSMPEVAAAAACLVNPFDVDDIRSGIIKLTSDDEYRNKLLINGRKNKLRFDAGKIADSYYDLYTTFV
jgi:glycosyltransferase involved in cell wall biosynthesis